MPEIDLSPIKAAITALKEKYPALVFKGDFELGEREIRGIFDVYVSRANNPGDAATFSMIVPNSMTSAKQYQEHIEFLLRERLGFRE